MKRRSLRFMALLICITLILSNASFAYGEDARQTVRVAFFEFDGYHHTDENGVRSGYGYEYLQEIAKYAEIKYDYVDCSWSEALDMLENGEVDLVTSAQKTPEREDKFLFSKQSIGMSSAIVTVKAGGTKFIPNDYSTLNNVKVGLLWDNSRNATFDAFCKENGINYTVTYYYDSESLVIALQEEEVEAIVTSNVRVLENEVIVAEFSASPYYSITNKNNGQLMEIIDEAHDRIAIEDPLFISNLYNKYYAVNNGGAGLALTAGEEKYINDNPIVTIGLLLDGAPLTYMEGSTVKGIIPETLRQIIEPSGLKVEFMAYENSRDYYKAREEKTFDVIGRTFYDLFNAEQNGILLTDGYCGITANMLQQKNPKNDLTVIGAVRGSTFTKKYVEANYSQEDIIYYQNYSECIEALKSGDVNQVILDTLLAEEIVAKDMDDQFISQYLSNSQDDIILGVFADRDRPLFSIINKCVKNVDEAVINNIIQEHTEYQNMPMTFIQTIKKNPEVLFVFCLILSICIIVIFYSIFQKREAERKTVLSNENARFSALVCNLYDDVKEFNLDKNKLWVQRWEGTEKKSIILNQDLFERIEYLKNNEVHPDDAEAFKKLFSRSSMEKICDQRTNVSLDCRMKQSDGSYRWNTFHVQGMTPDTAHPRNLMLYRKDIHEIKMEEEEKKQMLRDALDMAEMSNRAKSDFLSKMSHEIRTPLNAIIGNITIAKRSVANTLKVAECLDKVEFASKHLISLINDILDMSAIESGKMKISQDSIDLRYFISSISAMFYGQTEAKKIEFEVIPKNIEEEHLLGDQIRLNQILMNILSNAVKFTPMGGKISLIITQKIIRADEVFLQFKVQDSGIGMTQDFINRVGTPFEQQNSEIRQQFGGTGLGLSITKNLIMMMNGVFNIESKEGEGSTITVEMPLKIDKKAKINATEAQGFEGIKALVVDDEIGSCEYAALLLKGCGVEADYVISGEEAIKKITEREKTEGQAYKLCLIDQKMPEMSGIELIKKLRNDFEIKIPMVIMTSYNYGTISEDAKLAGAAQFISKPLFQSTVMDMLIKVFGRYNPGQLPKDSENRFKGISVLLAEDNLLNREIAVEILSSAGMKVDEVSDGIEALKAFTQSKPGQYDMILMDINMPNMDGYEATRKIRSSDHPLAETIPIIAISANAFPEDVANSLASGMNNHISKPIDVDKMFDILSPYFGNKE